MYELNRVRMIGIGPRAARFTDVTIDLSGVGGEFPARSLFDSGTLRRPAASSLLMLENGGGKTVLLKLLFSVVLPGRKRVVGGRSASLDQFVLDTDTGHVALEWMHAETGDTVVTGKVFQRRPRSSTSTNVLVESWYSFRPGDALNLANLPIAEGTKRNRLDGYHAALLEIAEPQMQLTWIGDEQGKWTEHLRALGLEPDLFDIQRAMNVDEGGAATAFKFTSSAGFIQWLLEAVSEPEDAIGVADTFAEWAVTLAARETMILERDFLDGAIAGLDPLADAYTDATLAQVSASQSQVAARRLAAALGTRHDAELTTSAGQATELDAARAEAAARVTERERARDISNEVRRQTRQLELDRAIAERDQTDTELKAAELTLEAWQIVPGLSDSVNADAVAADAAALFAKADSEAAPALHNRDSAAAQLLAALEAAARDADIAAQSHDSAAVAARSAAKEADGARREAHSEQQIADERARAARETVTSAEQRLRAAVDTGVLPPGTIATGVAAVMDRAADELFSALAALTARGTEAKIATESVKAAEQVERGLRAELRSADRSEDETRSAAGTATASAQRLVEHTVIADAAGAHDDSPLTVEDLDEHAEAILTALQTAAEGHREHLSGLQLEQREDQRVVDALGDGGLLPPRRDVELAVDKLTAAGVAAHAGWRYLHEAAPAAEREQLIDAHPELADGIVVTDGAQLDLARAILTEARLLPAAAVAVGTGALLLAVTTDSEHDRFVLETSPAMYDTDAAEQRRELLAAEMAARAARITDVRAQEGAQSAAAAALQSWRAANPPGHLPSLHDAYTTARRRAEGLRERHHAAEAAAAQAMADSEHAAQTEHDARTVERRCSDRVRDLSALNDAVAESITAAESLDGLIRRSHEQARLAAEAERARSRAQQSEMDESLAAERRRDAAARLRADMAAVESSAGKKADTVPADSLATLQAVYAAAQASYRQAAPGAELKERADTAAAQARKLRAALTIRKPEQLTQARALLAGPDGADRGTWERAADTVRTTRDRLSTRRDDLNQQVGLLGNALSEASPGEAGRTTWIVLPDTWRPTSVEHGRDLADAAQGALREAQGMLEEVNARVESVGARLASVNSDVAAFNAAYRPLLAVVQAASDAELAPEPAFAGAAADAENVAQAAIAELKATSQKAAAASQRQADMHSELIEFARQDRYEKMHNQARAALLTSSPANVAAQARDWSTNMLARRISLDNELDAVTRHRSGIVARLSTLVEQALKTLDRARTYSALPASLGDWAGKEFISIRFGFTDAQTIATRVGDVLDVMAAEAVGRTPPARGANRRDGIALLMRAVNAAVPKGFTVTLLKPDQVLREERVPVEEMNDVFSGGQELTAAIMLYCTLAALKANERGKLRLRHAGVLFLDNPIGKASARYLLDMQQSVAAALGVQLVYTTGLYDDRASAAFPLWVRLRNDADLRAGLKHIRVADEMRRRLPAEFGPGETAGDKMPGTLSSMRLYVRPPATTSNGGSPSSGTSPDGPADGPGTGE